MSETDTLAIDVPCRRQTVAHQFLNEAHTRAADSGCLDSWRQGRDRYYCWVIDIESEPVRERIERWQQRLAPWLLNDYQRQPHLTVAVGGFWRPEQNQRIHNDDFLPDDLKQLLTQLRHFSQPVLELAVHGCNSFPSAPFLEVEDRSGGYLSKLRQTLIPSGDDFRSIPYCPHITLGLYDRAYATSELSFLMTEETDRDALPLSVSHVSLVSYDSRHRAGPLRPEQRVPLGNFSNDQS